MVIGICEVELYLPENCSIKGKRRVVKSIITRVRNKFNVSAAEIDDNDKWQKIKLGFSVVSNDNKLVNSTLNNLVDFIENLCLAELIDYDIQIL